MWVCFLTWLGEKVGEDGADKGNALRRDAPLLQAQHWIQGAAREQFRGVSIEDACMFFLT